MKVHLSGSGLTLDFPPVQLQRQCDSDSSGVGGGDESTYVVECISASATAMWAFVVFLAVLSMDVCRVAARVVDAVTNTMWDIVVAAGSVLLYLRVIDWCSAVRSTQCADIRSGGVRYGCVGGGVNLL